MQKPAKRRWSHRINERLNPTMEVFLRRYPFN
jgi:hypothetical protein